MRSNKGSGVANGAPQNNHGRSAPSAPSAQLLNARVTIPLQEAGPQRPAASQTREKDAAKGRKAGQTRGQKQKEKLTEDDLRCEFDDSEELEDTEINSPVILERVAESPQDEKRHPGGPGEIRMSDLPMKVQKHKGDDFVVISDMNKVVALEDSTNQLDGPGLDGWEYIRRGEQDDFVISYAQAVAATNK